MIRPDLFSRWPWVLVAALIFGCGGGPDAEQASTPSLDAAPADRPGTAKDARVETRTCFPPRGQSGSPDTIFEVIALVNALPRPVTIPCFLESLDRPLRLNATSSVVSAQPSVGARSPRIFLFSGQNLILSVVPDGVGRLLLEAGQLTSSTRSIKGEIKFPVDHALRDEEPFGHLPFGRTTSCGLCHRSEEPVFGLEGAVESGALRPTPRLAVPLEDIRGHHARCDAATEPERCAFLKALFDHGPVTAHEFPAEMPTFF